MTVSVKAIKREFFYIYPVIELIGVEEWVKRFHSSFDSEAASIAFYLAGFLSSYHDTEKDPAYNVFAAWELAKTNPLTEHLFESETGGRNNGR